MNAIYRFGFAVGFVVAGVLFAPVLFALFTLALLIWLVLGLPFAMFFGRVVRWADGTPSGNPDDGARRCSPRGIETEQRGGSNERK